MFPVQKYTANKMTNTHGCPNKCHNIAMVIAVPGDLR